MTVSLLPDRLCLLRFPRQDLELCSHAILKQILFRDYSHTSRPHRQEPIFSYIDNSLEISIFGDSEAIAKDFPQGICPGLEVSPHVYRALQVDNDDTFNSSRICTIVEPLAKAGVSVFYNSTYQTDLLFVQEQRLPVVFATLSKHGVHVALDDESENMPNTPPITPIPDNVQFQRHPIHAIEEEEPLQEQDQEDCTYAVDDLQLKHLSLATPPGSAGSSSDAEYTHYEDEAWTVVADQFITPRRPLMPLNIISAQKHCPVDEFWPEGDALSPKVESTDEGLIAKASPTTTTAFELRQQAIRTVPENYLRCVGLNTELEAGYQPWILKVIKILFYHDKVKEEATQSGRGPLHDAPRFFSFTATAECVSMITDVYILEEFEEHELFMDMDTCPLRLIQLDLHRFGLDKFGIIHSVARPLTEAGIELLYISTFTTANILVMEHQLSSAEKILSGSGASTPKDAEAPCPHLSDRQAADLGHFS